MIFLPDGRTDGRTNERTNEGNPRVPRGPKKPFLQHIALVLVLISSCGFIFEHFPATHSSSADFKWWVFIFGKTINRSPELLNLAAHSFQSGMQEQCESGQKLRSRYKYKNLCSCNVKVEKVWKQIQIQKCFSPLATLGGTDLCAKWNAVAM